MSALEAGRPYMSIGEVLNVLKDEFPDVTVSKIRFLESEGLIQPERTSSGYRKFSEGDVDRLRFILRLQRDHFMPLKVIRERLDEWEASGHEPLAQPTLSFGGSTPTEEQGQAEPAVDTFRPMATGLSMSLRELEGAADLETGQLRELRSFGLLNPKQTEEGEDRYTEFDLEVARLCRDLITMGLEPRHLRLFPSTIDRWASLVDQVIVPLVKQRNPDARKQANDKARDMMRTGEKLMQTLFRANTSHYV